MNREKKDSQVSKRGEPKAREKGDFSVIEKGSYLPIFHVNQNIDNDEIVHESYSRGDTR